MQEVRQGPPGWLGACHDGSCILVKHDGDRVLVRDSKQADESPVLTFTPTRWRAFQDAAVAWDRDSEVFAGRITLSTWLFRSEAQICLTDGRKHLHFDNKEWDEFVVGVKAGTFVVPS